MTIRETALILLAMLLVTACGQELPGDDTPLDDNDQGDVDTPDPDDGLDDDLDEPEDPGEDDSAYLTDTEGRVFSYLEAGYLLPQSGPGHADTTVYRPDITFPTEDAAFLNSQVYRYGGSQGSINGMSGGQCHETNFAYPWQDTFCESRSRSQIMCPDGGHEGVDIRPATCVPETSGVHWAVAVEDGRIIAPSSSRYTVKLQTEDGTIYRYMHLKMDDLAVADGEYVEKGQRIGRIWNDFFDSSGNSVPTTYHLHFEMYQNYAPDEETDPIFDQVSPYMTLVNAYEKRLRGED